MNSIISLVISGFIGLGAGWFIARKKPDYCPP
jgi:hypothetical protein